MPKNTNWTPEKSHAEIWRILKEMAASHKATKADLKELAASHKATKADLKELAASHKATKADLKELAVSHKATKADLKELIAERKAEAAERKKASAELDAAMKDLAEAQSRADKRIDKVDEQLGGIGQNLGGVAEDFFYYNAPSALKKNGFRIDSYDRNIINDKTSKTGKIIPPSREYDIIGVNGDYVVVIEVKAMLKKKHINKFVKLLPHFVRDFPEHRGKKVYGGIAGMSLDEDRRDKEKEGIKKTVEKKGLFLLTQSDSEAAEVHKPGKGLTSLKNFGQGV